eukprot:g51578.t1
MPDRKSLWYDKRATDKNAEHDPWQYFYSLGRLLQCQVVTRVHNLDGLASVDLLEDGQRLVVKLDQQHLQGELRCDGNNVTREDVRDAFSHLVEAKQSLHFDPNKLHIIGPGFKIRMVLMTPAAAAPPAAQVSATPVPAAASKGSRNSSPTPLQVLLGIC